MTREACRLGSVVVGAVAAEPTSVAGRRLEAALRTACPGAETTVLVAYANAYAGYVATPEEYAMQRYEGGHTLFGPRTLHAWRLALEDAAARLGEAPARVPGPAPEIVDRVTLDRERELGRRVLATTRFAAGQA